MFGAFVLFNVIVALAVVADHDDDDHRDYEFVLPSGANTVRLSTHESSDAYRDLIRVVQLIAQDAATTIAGLQAQLHATNINVGITNSTLVGLEGTVSGLAGQLHATNSTLNALEISFAEAVADLGTLTSVINVGTGEGTATPSGRKRSVEQTQTTCNTITLFGNVRVISGSASNDTTGCGNLVTGYNQLFGDILGDHNIVASAAADTAAGNPTGPSSNFINGAANIVLGLGNIVNQRFGIVAGQNNTQSGADFASILGGENNLVTAKWDAVLTGKNNNVTGAFGVILGGQQNTVSELEGLIVDGTNNTVLAAGGALGGVIVDGKNNAVSGTWAVDVGGAGNIGGKAVTNANSVQVASETMEVVPPPSNQGQLN